MAYPREQIPCRSTNGELWFSSSATAQKAAAARCAACPVIQACRDTGRTIKASYGVWGGESPRQRRKAGYAPPKA
ncbi:hypothetical protein KNE206_77820 [Kitasatospora sp. NE20-6]|uniref:WhiB family transcriptional regulator n=1 Tax=Kitasatospora sp. NE20-6 TaxID=2859066 RepID=UPI0034DBB49C